jgi:hypothetical protein
LRNKNYRSRISLTRNFRSSRLLNLNKNFLKIGFLLLFKSNSYGKYISYFIILFSNYWKKHNIVWKFFFNEISFFKSIKFFTSYFYSLWVLLEQKMKKNKKSVNKAMNSGLIFDANKLLKEDSAVSIAGDHLYLIGLTNQCVNNENLSKRKQYFNPKIVFIINFAFLLRFIFSLYYYNHSENMLLFYYIGDFSAFIPGIKIHFNIHMTAFWFAACFCQVIHYLNSKKNSSYEWLKPFAMLSGIVYSLSFFS